MAAGGSVKKNHNKTKKNRKNKIHLVFDEAKRRDFLTGFHKRKLQRKKEAKDKLERDLKEERKRLKTEAKESFKKLVVSHRSIPELETLWKEEYVEDDATVRIEELSTDTIAKQNNWIGANQARCREESEEEGEDEEVPGMGLTAKKPKQKKEEAQQFDSEKDVKRLLKKEATKKVKKSKVFQMKNQIEKRKQKKKSLQMKKQRIKIRDKQARSRH